MPNWSCNTTRYEETVQTGQASTEHPHCRSLNCHVTSEETEEYSKMPSLGSGAWFSVLWGLSPGDKYITCWR